MIESVKPPPVSKKTPASSSQSQRSSQLLGQLGESQAVQYLKSQQYSILGTNIRYSHGEIDIVAHDSRSQEIVFVEVKTRSSTAFGDPSAAVNYPKIRAMTNVALAWLRTNQIQLDFRFDCVAVVGQSIRHYRNITWEGS